MRKQMRLERLRYRSLQLLHPFIRPPHPPSIQLCERRNVDFCLDDCVAPVALASSFAGTGDRADYAGVSECYEGAAVCGGLGADAGGEFAEFVPAAAILAEEGGAVG